MESFSEILILTPTDIPDFDLLEKLTKTIIPIIVLRGFIPEPVRTEAVNDLIGCRDHHQTTSYVNASLTTLGPYIAKHIFQPRKYFSLTREIDGCLPISIPLLRRQVYDLIKTHMKLDRLDTAIDTIHGKYSGSIVRFHADGIANPLHNDNIARDANAITLTIKGIEHQLSCVVCLQECTGGGALRLYKKKWCSEDEQFKTTGALGYQPTVVAQTQTCVFKPQNGDIYIFDPGFYHEIDRVEGDERITMGFFFGVLKHTRSEAIAWS